MEQNTKKSNIVLALLLSLLTALGGGIVFGIIYGIGYYIYILAAAEIYLACSVYLKYVSKPTWWHVVISIVWSIVWTFIFNLLAIVVCESIAIANEFGVSFADSFNALMNAWQTNAKIAAYMNDRMGDIIGMIFLGGIIYGASIIAAAFVAKKNKKTQSQNTIQPNQNSVKPTQIKTEEIPNTTNNNAVLDTLYPALFKDIKSNLEEFITTKNQEIFKSNLKETQAKYKLHELKEVEKTELLTFINSQINNGNISKLDKKVNETILKLIK